MSSKILGLAFGLALLSTACTSAAIESRKWADLPPGAVQGTYRSSPGFFGQWDERSFWFHGCLIWERYYSDEWNAYDPIVCGPDAN